MCVCVCVCILHHTPCVCISFCRVRYMYNIHRIISVCIVLRQTLVYSMRYANQSMHAQLRITFWYDVHKYSTIFGIRCCFWLCHSYIKRSNTVTDLSGCWWYLWMTNRYVWAIVAVTAAHTSPIQIIRKVCPKLIIYWVPIWWVCKCVLCLY